jgi:signal transduction histidine kinase
MFTPNFTTKSSGTGLGLSIVKSYVENAGGKIWFESESDKGTVFFLEFPLSKPDKNSVNQ